MQVRRCVGCDKPFYPKHANQYYHDAKCAKARWRDKDRPRVRRADPHPTAVQEFFRVVERAMPVSAVGYRLYCRELNVVLPIPGSRRRDGSRPATANFTLKPIEIPILPLDTSYVFLWVYPGDSVMPQEPQQTVTPGWKDDVSQKRILSFLVRNMQLIKGKSSRESARARSEQQNTALLEYFRVPVSPRHPDQEPGSLPPHQGPRSLPPHQQGNSGDDESSAD